MLKRFFKFNKILLLTSLGTLIFCFNSPQNDDEKMETVMVSVAKTLSYLSYTPKDMDKTYSEEVYKKYMEDLDPMKRYFLKSDVEDFVKNKDKLSDYLSNGNISFFKMTTDRLYKRVDQIDSLTQKIVSSPLNLDENDELILEPKLKDYPADEQALYNEWKRYIKYNVLQEMQSLIEKEDKQKQKKDSVVAHQKVDTIKYEPTTLAEKQIKATGEVKDLLQDTFRRFKKRKKKDWFSLYMNAYTLVFDPHTNYYSPKDKEDFDAGFSGKITGIGAQIMEKRGKLFVGPLVVGAPAWKSKQLDEGDEILKVKPAPDKETVNVVGMLIDEAVRLIRGPKGVEVVLTLKKKDGSVKEVHLVREEVEIEDTFAKSIQVTSTDGKKYGFIYLPSFNADFNDPKGRNASDDVKNEILKLKKEGVDGLILDLRNNGGGSLTEVVDIMGLFMDKGPVVQVKNQDGKIEVLSNKLNNPVWSGPLVLMQNELSASASEILAGAIQDYGRGVIVGSPQSYGKGTVQTFVSLNRLLRSKDDFGDLKLTIQKFYRISGNSTQNKGVASDVIMDDYFTYEDVGERFDEFALPYDKIAAADYQPLNKIDFKPLIAKNEKRIKDNRYYQLMLESARWREQIRKEEKITLNKDAFFQLMKDRKEQLKKFDDLKNYQNGLQFTQHADEVARIESDEAFAEKSKNWIKNLKRDLYLEEAVQVLSDIK